PIAATPAGASQNGHNGASHGKVIPSRLTGELNDVDEGGFSLSWGLAIGTTLAVLAAAGVIGLYLRQSQQQAAQAPLAQLAGAQVRAVLIDSGGYWVANSSGLLHSLDGRSWQPAAADAAEMPDETLVILPQ